MCIVGYVILFLIGICLIGLVYCFYQLIRNEAVYRISMKWCNDYDFERIYRHSYDDMFNPKKENWYGLKFPRDKHFK